MATSLSTPKLGTILSSSTLQTFLYRRKFSILNRSSFTINPQSASSCCYSSSFNFSKKTLGFLSDHLRLSVLNPRRFASRAESTNGGEPRHYDFDLFTIGAGSGGVRASRFAANFGASVAVCELPFATISSETTGGIRDFVAEKMSLKGIEFHTEESPQAVIKSADGSFSFKTNKGITDGFCKPNTKNLGLETVGVKLDKNEAILVDEYSCTSVPSIWAVGDVTDRMNLTPVALMEGGALAKTLFANEPTKPDFRAIPSAVFSQPPIGQVGLNEQQAVEEYGDIDVYTANFRPLKATLSGLPDRVFMKLVVYAKTNQVIGLHMCGEDSAEIVQGFAVAIKAGLTKMQFDSTVGVHPTSAEEFVTMRTPTRKIRNSSSGGKTDSEAKAAAGV
ncbi:hypothetical protein L1987_63846 [Smallanthus sonchifolius]|uniref:Uncharacterized protein n=1 Tax=Smallanthus sonchifolius TaxID=185202 RepID=A0ACB9CED8_9ASTR|nr:hypothetical protein L1987_63846 [Smallanthus sonchifolius]